MTAQTREKVAEMVLQAPSIPASDKAELVEWLADDGGEETISFEAAAKRLGVAHYRLYRLCVEGELRTRKIVTVKTAVTVASLEAYIAKGGK